MNSNSDRVTIVSAAGATRVTIARIPINRVELVVELVNQPVGTAWQVTARTRPTT